ncbi:MAG: hypothetical protein ABJE66_28810 [Deltaproteobacteria bacterium]
MKLLGAIAVLALLGCGTDDEDTSTVESPIISATAPFFSPPAPLVLPVLGLHGHLPEAADPQNTSLLLAHSAQYSNGLDLGPANENRDSYNDLLASPDRLFWKEAPNFQPYLQAALTQADAHMGELTLDSLHTAGDLLADIGFAPEYTGPTPQFAGYPVPRARWMDARWLRPAGADLDTHYTYPAPYGLRAFPERGARLYCAAREVARNQTSGSLGKQVLLPLSILGQELDIGVFEPTAFVNNPERIPSSSSDGAQAFNVPFTLGIQITPVYPVLPTLPELRYPLVLSTADSEIVTNVGRGLIVEDRRCISFFGYPLCIPIVKDDYRYRYRTLAHADTALSTGASMKSSVKIPVFWAGPLLVNLGINLGASVGQAIPPRVSDTHQYVSDDRLLYLTIPPPGWGYSHREGATYEKYLDGFWFGQSFVADDQDEHWDVASTDDDHNNSLAGSVTLTPTNPLRPLVHANDDHHVAPTSEILIGGGVEGVVGFDVSIATLEVKASGEVNGTLGLAHDVRDAVNVFTGLDGSALPIAGVTVTPVTYGHADLHFNVNFHLHISLPWPLDDIDVRYDIIDSTTPFAHFQNTWGEGHKLRIGTESTLGDPTYAPAVPSQLGTTPLFASFPPSAPTDTFGRQSVTGCLADTTAVPAPPPPCKSRPAAGPPPETSNCVYMEFSPELDRCLHIPPPGGNKRQNCNNAMLTYMCGSVSKEQFYDDGTGEKFVLAHRLALNPPADPSDLHSPDAPDLVAFSLAVQKCADADDADGLIAHTPTGPSDWFKSRFTAASCNGSATLYKPSEIITTTGKPGAVEAGGCTP